MSPGTPGHGGFCKAERKQLLFLGWQQGGLVQENEMKAAFQRDSPGEGKPGGLSGRGKLGRPGRKDTACLPTDYVH